MATTIMSRVAYASLGRRGSFALDARYSSPLPPVETVAEPDVAAEAYRAGYEEGKAAAQAEAEATMAAERAHRGAIELAFARFDEESQRLLRDRMTATVHALCEEAIMPLALDTQGLARRVDAAAAMLQRKHDQRVVHIHPDDLALIEGDIADDISLVSDPSVERGGLRLETEDGGVEDGPRQWRRALAEIFDTCST